MLLPCRLEYMCTPMRHHATLPKLMKHRRLIYQLHASQNPLLHLVVSEMKSLRHA